MRKKIVTLITATMLVLGITACGGSSTNTGNAGNTISDAMTEEIGEATPAPTEEPAPTPEPTAIPEPTLAPIEWTTEEGTLLPTELIVIVKGSPVKLPCTVSEYMERTGEKIFKSDVNEGKNYGKPGIATVMMDNYGMILKTTEDAESFKDYIIYNIYTSSSMCDENHFTDITLPGDIHLGSQYNSWEDVEEIYGTCDAPIDPLWWNVSSDTTEEEIDIFSCTWDEIQPLLRGYGIMIDGSGLVTELDIKVSDDKLKELYGN